MHRAAQRGFTLTELVVAIVLLSVAGWLLNDLIGNDVIVAKRSARVCRSNLRGVAATIMRYRAEHHDKYPLNASALKSYLVHDVLRYHDTHSTYTYTCRFTPEVKNRDIVCWDSKPHGEPYRILRWKNRPYRNVLFGDGTIAAMPEQQFQNLKIEGDIMRSQ